MQHEVWVPAPVVEGETQTSTWPELVRYFEGVGQRELRVHCLRRLGAARRGVECSSTLHAITVERTAGTAISHSPRASLRADLERCLYGVMLRCANNSSTPRRLACFALWAPVWLRFYLTLTTRPSIMGVTPLGCASTYSTKASKSLPSVTLSTPIDPPRNPSPPSAMKAFMATL